MKLLADCILRPDKGFTLVEVIVGFSILALLIGISSPLVVNFYNQRQLDEALNNIVQTLRRAQLRAMKGEGDSLFGVHFTSHSFVLFKGESFTNRDPGFDEAFELSDNISLSGISEVVFSKLEGMPSQTGDIILTLDEMAKVIDINEQGRVNY